jgi:valienol-1-phosphate guanylyltransferase
MRDVRTALLAGGLGERLGRLTARECKPLVPYAGTCRLVDFSMANVARSGLREVVLLAQHGERELIGHLLRRWDGRHSVSVHFGRQQEAVRASALSRRGLAGDCVMLARPPEHGTADALLSNAEWLFAPGARDLLVLHADHVYVYDYAPMVREHRNSGADLTIGVQRIETRFVRLFGMVDVGAGGEVRRLVEKPAVPSSNLIFTAFCLFRIDVLEKVLATLAGRGESGWRHDISRDVIPFMIEEGYRVRAHQVPGYWADIGTVPRYLLGHLALVQPRPAMPVAVLPRSLPGADAVWLPRQRVIASGPLPERAHVRESVLFPGCLVEPGARVERAVLLPGACVTAGVDVRDTVVLSGEALTADRFGVAELVGSANG